MKKKEFDNVYQFKIVLKYTEPPVWRRIQVPENYTFWELHVAIQDAMGWDDEHLHEFRIKSPHDSKAKVIGIPDEGFSDVKILSGLKQNIADWFSMKNKRADYTYDFGDDWEHDIILEEILPRDRSIRYPVCIDGKQACPPEDCGSIPGYEDICDGVSEYQEDFEDYDPEHFDLKEVHFDDPKKRLK